jgi:hypothetical protein
MKAIRWGHVLLIAPLLVWGAAHAEQGSLHESMLPAPAAAPATRPAVTQPFNAGMGMDRRTPRFLSNPQAFQDRPTTQQITDAEAFVNQYSPIHFRIYQAAAQRNPDRHERIQWVIVHGYLDLQVVKGEDADLYQMKLDEIRLQDKFFGILWSARDGFRPLDRTDSKLREELRPVEMELIAKRKEEASHRLAKMQLAVEREKQKLASLETPSSGAVDSLIDQDIDNSGRVMMGPPGSGQNRGGPQRGGDR